MKINIVNTVFVLTVIFTHNTYAAQTVYIPLGSGNQVIAVDAAKDTITNSFAGVENPHGLVATPDGEYLIAGSLKEVPLAKDQPQDAPNSKLYFIHPAHGHVMSTIPVSGWTHHQAITPDGKYVLSSHGMRGYVSVVDLENNKVMKYIKTGKVPNYILITKDGLRAFVSSTGENKITEINLHTWEVARTLESGPAPEHMAFSGDQTLIFVANPRRGEVSVVSVKTGKILTTYSIGNGVHGLDIGDDGKTLFVSSKKDNKLVSINTHTRKKTQIELSPAPYHLNTIKGSGKVYVSSRKKPIIWVIDQNTLKVVNTIPLPAGEAHQMAVVNE